jgi:transcriptional regulator with XRE-family HTH domain
MNLIQKLHRHKARKGLTQTQLAYILGISIQFTSRCMSGKQKLPMRVVLASRDIGAGITIADIMDYLTSRIP